VLHVGAAQVPAQREASRGIRRQLTVLGVTTTVLVLVATLVPSGATAQEIARGQVDYTEVVGGPTDVIMLRVRLEPGASQGWHTHPGPVWVVVTSGEVSAYRQDGCSRAYTPGEAFLE
jgi:quercetin dioxygenase-like cupin family protein